GHELPRENGSVGARGGGGAAERGLAVAGGGGPSERLGAGAGEERREPLGAGVALQRPRLGEEALLERRVQGRPVRRRERRLVAALARARRPAAHPGPQRPDVRAELGPEMRQHLAGLVADLIDLVHHAEDALALGADLLERLALGELARLPGGEEPDDR